LIQKPLQFRAADLADITTLFDIRQAAIRQLSTTHLSDLEAIAWADRSGTAWFKRIERALANGEVWVATRDSQILGWLHRAGNSIEGLYVSPTSAHQGVGSGLIHFAEAHIAQEGHRIVVLESSLNALAFYMRLGYTPTVVQRSSVAIGLRKEVTA
jgi:GNAT superfamily N-acetyltransferase